MSTAPDVDEISKQLPALCGNSPPAPLGYVSKTQNNAAASTLADRPRPKGLLQKFKNLSFRVKSQTSIVRKREKRLNGCKCKATPRSYEYCATIGGILDRIERMEVRQKVRSLLSIVSRPSGQLLSGGGGSKVWDSLTVSGCRLPTQASLHEVAEQRCGSDQLFLHPIDEEAKNSCGSVTEPQLSSFNTLEHDESWDAQISPIHGAYKPHKPKPNKCRPLKSLTMHPTKSIDSQCEALSDVNYSNACEEDDEEDSASDFKLILQRSAIASDIVQDDVVGMIEKDLRRTFQHCAYFANEDVQFNVKMTLHQISLQHDAIGYVQGMNFIAGCVAYHCNNFVDATKIMSFIVVNLQLEHVYSFVHLYRYIDVLQVLLQAHTPVFYSFTQNVLALDYSAHLIDWFFCLGTNKIPLEHSAIFLDKLLAHGWYYFYRVLVVYFKAFEERHAKLVRSTSLSDTKKIDTEVAIKNFHKEKSIDWGTLLKKAATLSIDDSVVREELVWHSRDRFARPGHKTNN